MIHEIPLPLLKTPAVTWTQDEMESMKENIIRMRQEANDRTYGTIQEWPFDPDPKVLRGYFEHGMTRTSMHLYYKNLTMNAFFGPIEQLPLMLNVESCGTVVPYIARWRLEYGK